MPEVQGCLIGNLVPEDTNCLFSMEGNGISTGADIDTQILR